MRSVSGFVLVVSLLPGTAFGQHTPRPAPKPAAIEVSKGGATVPMGDWGGRPVVEVTIDGRGPYKLILDTGAHMTVIDDTVSAELSLPGSEQEGRGPVASIGVLRFGDVAVKGLTVMVRPLHRMLNGEDAPRGVLSAAAFPGHLVVLDYPGKTIGIRKGALEAADAQTTFDYESSEVLPTVPVSVAGTTTRVHLDTGAPDGLTLPTKFLKTLPLTGAPREAGKARTHMGDYPISKAEVNGPITLGRFALALPEVSFSDVAPGPTTPVGQIGYEVLRRFVVTFDSKNRRIRFAQPAGI
jgi:hypothetical protein